MKNYILYIGDFKFSRMDAEFQLVLGNAYLFKELGYSVAFIGNDQTLVSKNTIQTKYEDFFIHNLEYKKNGSDIKNILKLHKQLVELIEMYDPSMICCYGSLSLAVHLFLLRKYCKKNNIKFIVNCVDLPLINNGSIISRIVRKVDRYLRQLIYKNSDGLIAVSKYISTKLNAKNVDVVIPPVRINYKQDYLTKKSDFPSFMYAGVPFPLDGRKISNGCYKDRLDKIIEIFSCLEHKYDFIFDVYGISLKEYLLVIPQHKNILEKSRCIRFHGKIEKEKCDEMIKEHDFMVLLRDENRTSLAGFSTKVVDSISLGTPVILNPIGDVTEYLKDNYNSIFVSNISMDISLSEFENILSMKQSEITLLKSNCKNYNPFYYRNFLEKTELFFKEVLRK
ncbi:glycosyltransferase [Holdemania filiformis]|uniref:glycosyltransferase n=1 Tax=Holdemania filiformis TaxID=61171 RepID=UPI0022E61DAF|nr:glycosyltransferase [Holdemania filiformis]